MLRLIRWCAALATVFALEAAPPIRDYYLRDLPRPHAYTPAKNSFLIEHLVPGNRRTLLDVGGAGSVRHIWSTWSVPGDMSDTAPPGVVYLRVFVDGDTSPSIAGTVDQLCRAAESTGDRYVPLPAFNYAAAWNFYLPIYFSQGIRIEVEALRSVDEFYSQIDYRLTADQNRTARLVSRNGALQYTGVGAPDFGSLRATSTRSALSAPGAGPFVIHGPGTLRRLTIRGDDLDQRTLQIWWDGDSEPAVEAPLRYFFADFNNAAMETKRGEMTCYFPMPFRQEARVAIAGPPGRVSLEYELDSREPDPDEGYFHALYHAAERTTGYAQYSALAVRGSGLFVGVNLFDTGHNHGGGDAALIDADSSSPHMLHGICGEDYFSFAWHHTGAMSPLTGAPAHERRYRLHLENPYPFHHSFQFLFGMFAGLQPKSVAFWYESPAVPAESEWAAFDIPWKALGPLGTESAGGKTMVPIKDSVALDEQWQDAPMKLGFVDLTYLFRHYIFTVRGTGFVPGRSRTEARTFVYCPSKRTIAAILGHDDAIVVKVSGEDVAELPGRVGFHGERIHVPLRQGWNQLDVVVSNEENVDWRWCGFSLALEREGSRGLKFSGSEGETAAPVRRRRTGGSGS